MAESKTWFSFRFYSNLSGTTLVEVVLLGASVPIGILVRRALSALGVRAQGLPGFVADVCTVGLLPLAVRAQDTLTFHAHIYTKICFQTLFLEPTRFYVFSTQKLFRERLCVTFL